MTTLAEYTASNDWYSLAGSPTIPVFNALRGSARIKADTWTLQAGCVRIQSVGERFVILEVRDALGIETELWANQDVLQNIEVDPPSVTPVTLRK